MTLEQRRAQIAADRQADPGWVEPVESDWREQVVVAVNDLAADARIRDVALSDQSIEAPREEGS